MDFLIFTFVLDLEKKIKEQSDYGYLPRSEIRRIWTILKDAIAIFNRKL